MFGYVKAYKPEMKMSEYDTYKAIYCSLCRQLGKDFGLTAKLILSYDFTFLALLRLAALDACCGYTTMRCPFNPLKKCYRLKDDSEEMSYTAACVVLLFYYKLKDNIADSGFFGKFKSYLLLPFFARYRKKACKQYAQVDQNVDEMMRSQKKAEDEKTVSFDKAADPTAVCLSKLFNRENNEESRSRIYSHFGYCVGKYIYLMDALDDLEEDIKRKNYNVIAHKYLLYQNANPQEMQTAKEAAKALINSCIVQAAATFELLELKRYQTIIGNILYLGMPNALKIIMNKQEKDSKPKSEGIE